MYISVKKNGMLNIMDIRRSFVPLCSFEDFDQNAPAVPEQAARGPKHTSLFLYITSCHQKIKTKACPGQKIQEIGVLLQYQGHIPEGPRLTLTFVFPTPTHIPNIITIHPEVLKLC